MTRSLATDGTVSFTGFKFIDPNVEFFESRAEFKVEFNKDFRRSVGVEFILDFFEFLLCFNFDIIVTSRLSSRTYSHFLLDL
jgi:hypothetical protein